MIRAEAPLETVPMVVRGGAIIPLGPEMRYTGEKPFDPITFAIYPDEKGSASTTLYEDDGLTPSYEQGVFRRTNLSVRRAGVAYRVSVSSPEGSYNPGARRFTFVNKTTPTVRPVTMNDTGSARTIELR